jgi:signal transduction histidine kinase
VTSLVFLSSLIFPIIFIEFLEELILNHPEMTNAVKDYRANLIIIMLPIQLLFIGVVFIFMIFLTHKVAGPMYKLKEHLAGIRDGEAARPLTFRQGDYFMDVAEEISRFIETVKENQETDFEYLEEVTAYIENLSPAIPDDKRPVLKEISRRLSDILERYNKTL